VVTKYYFTGGQVVALRQGGVLSYLFSDHLGSTTVTADSSATKTAEMRYKPWGETRYTSGTTPTARHYTGQYEESGIGLYFYNARWYDPLLGRFAQADTLIPQPGSPLAWDRFAYTLNNPVNFTDPSGHASIIDDGDTSSECGVGECYISYVGGTPGLPYYPTSSATYGENVENSSSGGGTMDGGVKNLPDINDSSRTIKKPISIDVPSAAVGAIGIGVDLLIAHRNFMVSQERSRINVFAFYRVEGESLSIKSLDIQNPTAADVTITGVRFSSSQLRYSAQPGSSIYPQDGNIYAFSPVAKARDTTTISLIPSGYTGNPTNTFLNGCIGGCAVGIIIRLVQTRTGMQYKWIQGIIR
jgi:RHS repeat-associated protein